MQFLAETTKTHPQQFRTKTAFFNLTEPRPNFKKPFHTALASGYYSNSQDSV